MRVRESQSARNQSSLNCHARANTPCQSKQGVKASQPYDRINEENQEARGVGQVMVAEGKAAGLDIRVGRQPVGSERYSENRNLDSDRLKHAYP